MTPKIYTSTFAPLPPLTSNISFSEFIAHYNPDNVPATKVVHSDTLTSKTLTYGSLRSLAATYAYGLRHTFGLQEGSILMALGPNSTDFLLLAHSVWWCGGIFSPLNPSSTVKDIVHVLEIVRPSHLCVHPDLLVKVREALNLSTSLEKVPKVLTINERSSNTGEKVPLFPDDLASGPSANILPPYSLTEAGKDSKTTPLCIAFSSGTTGPMKAVALSHHGSISNTMQMRTSVPGMLSAHGREVFFPPYCHVYGLSSIIMYGMWIGSYTCAIPSFDLETFCRLMAKDSQDATWTHIVPPIAVLLANSPVPLKYDLSGLKIIVISAAPTKKELAMKLQTRFPGVRILQGYGCTEAGPSVMMQSEWDGGPEAENIGCCGRLASGTEARLVDPETMKDVEEGQEGELLVCGPQVMIEYVRNKEATDRTVIWEDGKRWLRTGDIMRVDQTGDWFVTDRYKELIKYKGFQIPPSELEDLLLKHKDVVDAAVCSFYNDDEATEWPIAYVSLSETKLEMIRTGKVQKQRVLDEVKTWIDGQVAGYKKLRGGVHHLQELPKTPSGKILRRELPAKKKAGRTGKL